MATSRRSESEWKALVAEWTASGQSRKAFAAARGISRRTFGWWAWRLGPRAVADEAALNFVDVVVAERAVSVPGLVVEVGQVRVRVPVGFDAREVRRLVDALC